MNKMTHCLALPLLLVALGCDVDPFCIFCPDGPSRDGGPSRDATRPEGGREGCIPTPEECNAVDDDCDDEIDEDVTGTGAVCGVDEGPCETGIQACQDGHGQNLEASKRAGEVRRTYLRKGCNIGGRCASEVGSCQRHDGDVRHMSEKRAVTKPRALSLLRKREGAHDARGITKGQVGCRLAPHHRRHFTKERFIPHADSRKRVDNIGDITRPELGGVFLLRNS